MTSWSAPYTGGYKRLLPAGEEFKVALDPPPGATAVYCDARDYDKLHVVLIPQEDREAANYSGFYLAIRIADIVGKCEQVNGA